jgi:hypothetical protein
MLYSLRIYKGINAYLSAELLPVRVEGDQVRPWDDDSVRRRRVLEIVHQIVVHL